MNLGKIIEELAKLANPWVVNGLFLIIGFIGIIWLIMMYKITIKKYKRFSDTEEEYIKIVKEHKELGEYYLFLDDKYNIARKRINHIKRLAEMETDMMSLFFKKGSIDDKVKKLLSLIAYSIERGFLNPADDNRIGIWKSADNEEELYMCKGVGFKLGGEREKTLKINDSIAGGVYIRQKTRYCEDVTTEHDFRINPDSSYDIRSMVGVPILAGQECLGVLTIDSRKENAFSPEDIDILELYTNFLAIVILLDKFEKIP